jgi:hypothetical protein
LVNQVGWNAIQIPVAGTPQHVMWSARQLARKQLRRAAWIHRPVRRFLQKRSWRPEQRTTGFSGSGPAPFEHQAQWLSFSELLYTFTSCERGGLLDSTWFDVHAAIPGGVQ